MDWPKGTGYLVFFSVPILLWVIGALAVKRRSGAARAFAFIAGSDNRLSLSRFQAFLWTLIIFGSFAAAMAIHTKITPITTQESADKMAAAKAAAEKAATTKIAADARLNEAKAAAEKAASDKNAADMKANLTKAVADTAAPEAKADANKDAASARIEAAKAAALKATSDQAVVEAQRDVEKATEAKAAADRAAVVSGSDWVKIPPELLALAGIAIGSGVFSSLISALNKEEKTAYVTSVKPIVAADIDTPDKLANFLKTHTVMTTPSASNGPYCLVITGREMKKEGRVRFGSQWAPIRKWNDEGTEIIVDVPRNPSNTLVIDTANGKLCYNLRGDIGTWSLGQPTFRYEFSDLFRDDKNPYNFDLMKFQMFGWTVVAVVIYVYLFLISLDENMEILPKVDQSIVILTGLSQAGYLTGKAVSNVGSTENRQP